MTSAELVAALGDRLKNTQLVVVANREPYIHLRRTREEKVGFWRRLWGGRQRTKEEVTWIRPASGLVTALDPVMRACGGTWVAHGSGAADRDVTDAKGRVRVPPDRPATTSGPSSAATEPAGRRFGSCSTTPTGCPGTPPSIPAGWCSRRSR